MPVSYCRNRAAASSEAMLSLLLPWSLVFRGLLGAGADVAGVVAGGGTGLGAAGTGVVAGEMGLWAVATGAGLVLVATVVCTGGELWNKSKKE